jgi:hypothetical protein
MGYLMASDNPDDDFLNAEPTIFRWPFGWGSMIVVGLLVYEITAQPHWGIAVSCLKFVWNDLTLGWWWFRRDTWVWRGLCGMFMVWCRGIAKYAAIMFPVGIVLLLLNPEQNGDVESAWFASMIVAMLAMMSWFVGGLLISGLALVGGVKLWLDSELLGCRRLDEFPPVRFNSNQTVWLLGPAWLMGACTCACGLAAWIGNKEYVGAWPLVMLLSWPLSKRIIAQNSGDCWNSKSESNALSKDVETWN